jgi:RNA polymerase sigma factor (sigma-70 family)
MLRQVRSDDARKREEACHYLWQRYSQRLLEFACRKLSHHVRRRKDEHDVVNEVFYSLCRGQQHGDFDLNDRNELWKMLVTIALRRISNDIKFQRRARRDYRREERDEPFPERDETRLSCAESPEVPPEKRVAMKDELERLMDLLPARMRQVAIWKISGYTNQEIADPDKLNCSVRTVERKLNDIRRIWCGAA